jgi:TadE-like protein
MPAYPAYHRSTQLRTTANCTQGRSRRGAAIVEFAVCLPLLMLIILGTIEATHGIFLKQGLSAAAYEGIREAIDSRSTTALARSTAEAVLRPRQIKGFNVSFTPSDVASVARSQEITIEVSAPFSQNSPFIGHVMRDRTVTARATMIKE